MNEVDYRKKCGLINFLAEASFLNSLVAESESKAETVDYLKHVMITAYNIFHAITLFVFLFHFYKVDNFANAKDWILSIPVNRHDWVFLTKH